jgi:NAD(P)-dependent dehydrogenase (short-subunit alcohol dehydrogenase family)
MSGFRRGATEVTLQNQVVVITGASSGLGRAASVELARLGCRVVLAARRVAELERTAALCRAAGGDTLVVPTDVTDPAQIQALVSAALQKWHRIDVWINNAGVTMVGLLQQGPVTDHERVIETNLMGPIHAARAIVPVFIEQRSGTMINVASILGKVGQAFVPSYTISKFGLRGLSETLRVQLADYPDIHVCTLLPYAIDTPHFESGANAYGRAARAMQPVQSPERVASAMVSLIQRPRRELHVPRYAAIGFVVHWLFPRTTERVLLHALRRFHLSEPEADTTGALYSPLPEPGSVRGTRQAAIGRPAFALWVLREVTSIVVGNLSRWGHSTTTRL